jgi:hypothetical protein
MISKTAVGRENLNATSWAGTIQQPERYIFINSFQAKLLPPAFPQKQDVAATQTLF